MKRLLATLAPAAMLRALGRHRDRRAARRHEGMSGGEVFADVYARGGWGPGSGFHSGAGSHDARVVEPYVAAVRRFLAGLGHRPDAVDLGCGDFAVGARLRDLCADYLALDAVAPLIAENRRRHAGLGVRFEVLDLTRDPLPTGEVVFLRQVLQHLSNGDIARVLAGLAGRGGHLIVTEHFSARRGFVPNLDIATGPHTRLLHGSGVDIAAPPFSLEAAGREVICDVPEPSVGGRLVTTLYRLDPGTR